VRGRFFVYAWLLSAAAAVLLSGGCKGPQAKERGSRDNIRVFSTDVGLLLRGTDLGDITDRITSDDADKRREGVLLLGKTRQVYRKAVFEKVVELLEEVAGGDPEPLVRSAAALSLYRILGKKALPILTTRMEDASPLVRSDCARLLCSLCEEEEDGEDEEKAVKKLLEHLENDSSIEVRTAIARELRSVDRDDVIYGLMQCLKTRYQKLQFAAGVSLAKLSGRDFSLDYDYWLEWYTDERIGTSKEGAKKPKKRGILQRIFGKEN